MMKHSHINLGKCISYNRDDINDKIEDKILFVFKYNNHFSISKPSTIYCVLGELCYGPVLFGTGPVTTNTNPVTLYTYPVLTITVKSRRVYYRY